MSERKICSFISKVRDIFEKICNGKGVRKLVALISGAVVALVSTAYMLCIDTIVNSQVYYLFGLAVFGLGAGILQVISSNNLIEEEDKFSWVGLTISAFMGIGLILSINAIIQDPAYLGFLASTEKSIGDKIVILLLELATTQFAFVNVLIVSFAAVLTTREHFAYIHNKGSEKTKHTISIVKKVLSASALVLVIGAFAILLVSPIIDGSIVYTYKEGVYRFQSTTSYSLQGMNVFFGGNIELLEHSEIIERTGKLDPVVSEQVINLVAQTSTLAITSFALIVLGTISSLVLVLIKKTEKMMYVRILTGLLVLIGGLISFSFYGEIVNVISSSVVEGTTFQIGAGVTAFSIITVVAGIILTTLPLIEVEKKAAKIVE